MLTVGCSSKPVTIKLTDAGIFKGSKPVPVSEYKGYKASYSNSIYTIDFVECLDIESCPSDTVGMFIENMDKYKKAYYYSQYLNTQLIMHVPMGDTYVEAHLKLVDDEAPIYEAKTFYKEVYEIASELDLTMQVGFIDYNDQLLVNVEGQDFRVNATNNEVVIPSLLKVSQGTMPKGAKSVTIGTTALMKSSSSKYDYYGLGSTVIMVPTGYSVENFITFK